MPKADISPSCSTSHFAIMEKNSMFSLGDVASTILYPSCALDPEDTNIEVLVEKEDSGLPVKLRGDAPVLGPMLSLSSLVPGLRKSCSSPNCIAKQMESCPSRYSFRLPLLASISSDGLGIGQCCF